MNKKLALWEGFKLVTVVFLCIAIVLLTATFGYGWILRLFSSGMEHGLAWVAGAVLAVGTLNLVVRLLIFLREVNLDNGEEDDDGPDEEPPEIVIPPDFPFRVRQAKGRRPRKK